MSALRTATKLYNAGKMREAIPYLQRACDEEPHNPETWYRCGLALIAMRDYKGSTRFLQAALKYDQANAGAHYNLGVAYEASGNDKAAERCYLNALSIQPSVIPHVNLGGIYYRGGDHTKAYDHHSRALETETTDPDELGQRSFVRLLRGDYATGFREYECRWQSSIVKSTNWQPSHGERWNGEHIEGETLLVYAEQGLGDAIQMLRYIPLLRARGITPVLMLPSPLVRLVRKQWKGVDVRTLGTVVPTDIHWHVPMMSLPGVMGTTVDTTPWAGPYLRSVGGLDTSGLVRTDRPLIGLCWRGNRDHMNDHDRSMPSHVARRLTNAAPGAIDWISLDREDCFYALNNMSDTADLINMCDAVVTVDTGVAHLAGAMGKPVLMMPPSSPEWRWGLDSDRTPWYPTMRLYRRMYTDDWLSVTTRVLADIQQREWE